MVEYGIYVKLLDGEVLEIARYENKEEYESDLYNIREALKEEINMIMLYDVVIPIKNISFVKGETIQISLS